MSAKNRRLARTIALQALYELDSTRHSVADVLTARLEEQPLDQDPVMLSFVYTLVNGVLDNQRHLDKIIQQYAPEWPLEQVAVVDRNILRMAIFEFAIFKETPIKVAINEAIEVAKEYGSESAGRFISGVLGTLSNHESELSAALEDKTKR